MRKLIETPLLVTTTEAVGAGAAVEWDRLVRRTPGTDVTQLTAWAQLRSRVGFGSVHVFAYHRARIVGGAQVLVRGLPLVGGAGYLPYGPVIDADLDATLAGRTGEVLADALGDLARGRLRMLFVQPPEGATGISAELEQRGFRPSNAGVAPPGSIRIDLSESVDVIRSRFGKRLKSWTNRWTEHGVTVRRGGIEDVGLLTDLMNLTATNQGYPPLPHDYVAALYSELAAGGHAVLFVGEVDGAPVAADLMTGCAGMLRGRLSGYDRCGPAGKLSVPAAVRWQMIRWAKENSYRWFDFGGLETTTLDALTAGGTPPPESVHPADQPKLTFGGTAFRYPPAVEFIGPAPLRACYDLVDSSRAGRRLVAAARDRSRGATGKADAS